MPIACFYEKLNVTVTWTCWPAATGTGEKAGAVAVVKSRLVPDAHAVAGAIDGSQTKKFVWTVVMEVLLPIELAFSDQPLKYKNPAGIPQPAYKIVESTMLPDRIFRGD